ncbi:type III secretion system export apparatus subunit SctS [Rouxiella badensis]|jgi:type III secretion protein S|uniref:EscS/YscS/HrcS family type III secretion system export apparatus protein n=1 Tax=Rouxiella badensis TaxID=1646377 RepID=A0A1X0WIB9_9GAMM|nr:type III secretion system export apparatus subunit SctS [Rouxiella badensis]MCC3703319.1 type III secretion system export apparatus subunit SctS [Rouxiella badensis]MCC3718258.1 type III secretion system export apparatus subunit SctS [Rouxiella badensis]MCC3726974.1 type III secretion system export apparatus subunit SctS [Rouxiella badensis]MCC3731742.1 type III secretion system export apparatus subunit SctS [Rouxiella badensis]MCC3738677.1 type III secretion system export apparatus subunit
MSEAMITQLAAQMMWLILLLSLPVVVVASTVGVMVSLIQALTQVQEQTIQFLVKLVAVSITLAVTYHWMGDVLLNYAGLAFDQITQMRE